MIEAFEEIAKEESAQFYFEKQIVSMGFGVRSPSIDYWIKKEYKNSTIVLHNCTGTTSIGSVKCLMLNKKDSLNFEMITRSHFLNLFYFGKNRFKLSKDSTSIGWFFNKSTGFSQMKLIAKDTSFEPTIIGKKTNEGYELIVEYSLLFENWTKVIGPIILFYKEFIDQFE